MICKILICSIAAYIQLASGLRATTYGYGEGNCGDIDKPRPCSKGAVTASGEPFNPNLATAAIFAPTKLRMRARWVWLRVDEGPCKLIRVNDKGNPRYIGIRGFDLSPRAVEVLTGQPAVSTWSGRVYVCTMN